MIYRTILHDSELARSERLNAPRYSYCGICGRPWNVVKSHSIRTSERSECFAQCEDCWRSASDHEIRLCNELLYYWWLNYCGAERIEYTKEHLMRCVERALAERRCQVLKAEQKEATS